MYHNDGKINDIVLTIVNDGNGESCGGVDYESRKRAGRDNDVHQFRYAARSYDRYSHRVYGSKRFSRDQINTAADILLAYYVEHVKELV